MVSQDRSIIVRFCPKYESDLKRANLGKQTATELADTWARISAECTANPKYPAPQRAGTAIQRNNSEIYKIRIADPDRNVGKSGSYRLIYWWRREECELVGLFFYHKSEREDVTQKEIEAARRAFVDRTTWT